MIVSEVEVTQEWRNRIAEWLLKSGCLYVVAWGVECGDWHDTVDWTNLEKFDFGDVPDDQFVMTTWHTDEPLSEAMWFAGQCAFHPDIELGETVILHIAGEARKAEMMEAYLASQTMPPEEGLNVRSGSTAAPQDATMPRNDQPSFSPCSSYRACAGDDDRLVVRLL